MKHALKIILPIILILALIIGACCFFLIARRDLTESIFVYWGEHFYEAGRYSRAVSFYKAAMHFAPKDADLAIRLADAYKKSGNYTKAEYTLVSAITQIPDSVQLYVALSKTYVEQDKLLDAETMLGRITNDAVRTQIDALRPAAPVIEPESGNYSEYIDVTVTGASGARRWMKSVYVSDAPDSAVTVSVTVFTPTSSAYSPVPAALAAALSGEAVTVIRSVSFGTMTVYSRISRRNSGESAPALTVSEESFVFGEPSPVGAGTGDSGMLRYTGILNVSLDARISSL